MALLCYFVTFLFALVAGGSASAVRLFEEPLTVASFSTGNEIWININDRLVE